MPAGTDISGSNVETPSLIPPETAGPQVRLPLAADLYPRGVPPLEEAAQLAGFTTPEFEREVRDSFTRHAAALPGGGLPATEGPLLSVVIPVYNECATF